MAQLPFWAISLISLGIILIIVACWWKRILDLRKENADPQPQSSYAAAGMPGQVVIIQK